MAGRHAAAPPQNEDRSRLRSVLPAIAAVAVVAVLIGGTFAAFALGGPKHPTAAEPSKPDASSSDLADERGTDRAGRGTDRDDPIAIPTLPQTPSLAPTTAAPAAAPEATSTPTSTVTSTGSCGASYYETGTTTANGERFDPDGITAAHKTLPFNTRVRVTNPANQKFVVVRITDRGPFVSGRCIDLSRGAFKAIASLSAGVLTVKYEVLT